MDKAIVHDFSLELFARICTRNCQLFANAKLAVLTGQPDFQGLMPSRIVPRLVHLSPTVARRLQCVCDRVRETEAFSDWLRGLRDGQARARIAVRVRRLAFGNPGDVRPVGEGVSELRIDYGLGYRVYYVQRGAVLILLLCGGDKSTQDRDIKTAKRLAEETA